MKNLLILLCGFLYISCSSKKLPTNNFAELTDPVSFSGLYQNKNDVFGNILNIDRDRTDFINIKYSLAQKDTLTISYYTEDGLEYKYLSGKLEANFFEKYFADERINIPPIYMSNNVDRIRVGAGKNSDLLIHKWYARNGMILLLAAGGDWQDAYTFSKFDVKSAEFPIPFQQEGKWGFWDSMKNVLIEPKYDFVRLFHENRARVFSNGKWGLINSEGEELTAMKYDKIHRAGNGVMRVLANEKIGYINTEGREIIPAEYDEIRESIESFFSSVTRKGDKFGYATTDGVVSPPVFEKVEYFSCFFCPPSTPFYLKVHYKGEPYLMDGEGYIRKYKRTFGKLTLFEETKIHSSELAE